MLIPKQHRKIIYEKLFAEGVLVARKDFNSPKHPELQTVTNLEVIKSLTSLKSRGLVKEQFAWRHYYWVLTDEGIEYLRGYLHLPAEIVPATLKKKDRPAAPRAVGPRPGGERREPREGGREGYRREGAPGFGGEKKAGADAAGFKPEFRGGAGAGRGRGAPRQ